VQSKQIINLFGCVFAQMVARKLVFAPFQGVSREEQGLLLGSHFVGYRKIGPYRRQLM